jgi:hypothetical protein
MKAKLWLKIEKCLAFINNSEPIKNFKKLCPPIAKTKLKKSQNFVVVYQVGESNTNAYVGFSSNNRMVDLHIELHWCP